MKPYYIPKRTNRSEIVINKSHFITTVGYANTTDLARKFISDIKDEMPDANHHVYAFRVGYANTVTEGMSDDGEPTGTAGPPSLAVLRGTEIGDIVCVTTRYFGGKKLGTGGLVRAYTESLQNALTSLELELCVSKSLVSMHIPYNLYNIVINYFTDFELEVQNEQFAEDVSITVEILENDEPKFVKNLIDITSGTVKFIDTTKQ